MANQSVSWKGCDIPITDAQAWCNISITTRFAIYDVAKYHFWCLQVPQKACDVQIVTAWNPLCHNWCGKVPFLVLPSTADCVKSESRTCMWQLHVASSGDGWATFFVRLDLESAEAFKNVCKAWAGCKTGQGQITLLTMSQISREIVFRWIDDHEGDGIEDISFFLSFWNSPRRKVVNLNEDSPQKICEALAVCFVRVNCREELAGRHDPYQTVSLIGVRAPSHFHSQTRRQHHRWCQILFRKWRPCIGALMLVWNSWTEQKEPTSTRPWFQLKFRFTEVVALWPRICACKKCNQSARTRIHRSHPRTRVWFHT